MACRVEYNQENKILKVTKRGGKESSLFKKIAKHPMVESLEDALEVYKNTETSKMYQKEENYMVANRVGKTVFGSYKDAIQNNPSEVEVGFLDNSGNFLAFKKVQPSYDTSTEKGFINQYIKEGLISENKIINNGESYFQPGGLTEEGKGIKDLMLRQKALESLGWRNYKRSENGYKFGEHLKSDKGSEVNQILEKELKNILNIETSNFEEGSSLDENALKIRLLDLLNEMGVTVTSITDYVDKYKIKNGVEPSAKALADIANKVVAFKDGEISIEELTEEVSHFIVEGWNQTEIENLLRNIHRTQEWQQFSERYREIYSKKYKGEELEQAVRREVLGKVLSNSLKNNFSTENKQGAVASIINKVKELFNKLMDFVGLNTNQRIKEDLNNFTEQINDLLYQRQLKQYLNTDNFTDNNFVLYSAGKENNNIKGLRVEVEKSLDALRRSIRNLDLKNKTSDLKIKRALQKLQDLSAEEDLELQKQAAVEMAAVADTQLNYLNNLIKDSKNNDKVTFGANETAAFQTLTNNLDPLITSIRANIESNPQRYNPKKWAEVEKELKKLQERIADLKKNAKNIYEGTLEGIIDRVILKHEKLDEGYREHVREWLNAAHKDSTLFHRYFGQITNSSDPLLGLLSDVIERTANGGRQEYMGNIKDFLKKLEDDLGVKPNELKELFDNGYLVDEIDHAKVDETVRRISAEVRKQVTGSKDSVEDIMKMLEGKDIPTLDSDQSREYNSIFKRRLREIQQTFFNEAYYERLDEKYDSLGINKVTKNTIAAFSADRSQLLLEAVEEDGTVDWSKLTEATYEHLNEIKKQRKAAKDFYKENGDLKNGLTRVNNIGNVPSGLKNADGSLAKDMPVFESEGFFYFVDTNKTQDSLNTEGLVAIDLHKLDKRYVDDQKDKKTSTDLTKFLNKLEEVEKAKGEDAALKFFEANASIMLSKDFWDNMGTEKSFIDRIEEAINRPEVEDRARLESELNTLKLNISQRRALLSRHKQPNKTFEVSKVHRTVRERILELDSAISEGYALLSKQVDNEETSEEMDKNFEISVNEAYQNEVTDSELNIKEEIEFIAENSTSKANDRVSNFRYNLQAEAKGFSKGLTERQKQFVEEGSYDITSEDSRLEAIRDFAKTQIASYYKRLAPKEIDNTLQKNETESYKEYVDRLSKNDNLEITPNYSFLEDVMAEYKNPDFDPNYEGGLQVKKGDIERTVPVFNEDGTFKKTKTEKINFESEKYKNEVQGNPKKEAARQALLELQRKTLENYGLYKKHNIYKLPQITKKGIDRAVDTVKRIGRGGIRQGLEEMFSYRVDDIEYGETIGSTDASVVPTYYTRDIENKEELTDELFFSYATMYQQSVLHKHRKNNISEALAIKEAIESRAESGVGADTKNTISMFNNYFDYAFFGQNESQEYKVTIMGKKFDVTKMARQFLNFIKLRNLGFGTIVGATSYFTSEINFQIEKLVGLYTNKDALRLGSKEWARLAKDSIAETGKIRSKSKLNILGEFFNIFQTEERFNNSNYGYAARNLSKLPFSVHAMGNFPITPRAMMAVLHDFRITDEGIIMNKSEYTSAMNKKGMSKNEINAKWRAFESDVIYNYLDVSEEGVNFTEGLNNKLREDFRTQEYLDVKMDKITQMVKTTASQLDTQITSEQRVAAQRHFAMNYLMTHRGWLAIKIADRTKNSHFNMATGEFEEGSYRTFYNFMGEALPSLFKEKSFSAFTDLWNGKGLEVKDGVSVEDQLLVRRRNMRRVALDSAFLAGLSAIAYALIGYADDEPDNYAAQLSSYLLLRVLNEQVSGQTGLAYQMYETLNAPFVGLNVVVDTINLPTDLAFGSETVKQGRYKGETERLRAIKKVVPGMKTIDDMFKLQDTRDTYYFYNSNNLKFQPISALLVAGLDD